MAKLSIWLIFSVSIILTCLSASAAARRPPRPRPTMPTVGGLSPERLATPEIRRLVDKLKIEVKEYICQQNGQACTTSIPRVKARNYREQIVAGVLYFVSIKLDGNYYHIRIYYNPKFAAKLEGVVKKGKDDKIEYFQPLQPKPSSGSGSGSDSSSESGSSEGDNSSGSGEQPTGGGLSEEKRVDERFYRMIKRLEKKISEKICEVTGPNCLPGGVITPLRYKEQVVAGVNYFVRVRYYNKFYHVRIFEQKWTNTVEVVKVIGPKGKWDPIEYFE